MCERFGICSQIWIMSPPPSKEVPMLDQLINVLSPRSAGDDRFTGENMHPEAFRVYGGQVLAQCVSAAIATVEPDRILHSQHAYFLREGKTDRPIHYQVERARDGGSGCGREAAVRRDGVGGAAPQRHRDGAADR